MKLNTMLSECRQGDREAWNAFTGTFFYYVYFLTDTFLSPSGAGDEAVSSVVEDVFTVLSRNNMEILDEYEPGIPFTAFLRRLVIQRAESYCSNNSIESRFAPDVDLDKAEKRCSDSDPGEKMALSLYAGFYLNMKDACRLAGIKKERLEALLGMHKKKASKDTGHGEPLELIEDEEEDIKPGFFGNENNSDGEQPEGDMPKRRRRSRSSYRRRKRR